VPLVIHRAFLIPLAQGFIGRNGNSWARLGEDGMLRRPTHGRAPVNPFVPCDSHEKMTYVRQRHEEFDVLRVDFVAQIEMLSGSPLD
jgi:hypothetical protein